MLAPCLFVLAACGILASDDGQWSQLGLGGFSVTALVDTDWGLFAGTQYGGVFRFEEDGSWASLGLESFLISSFVFVEGSPSRLMVGVRPRDMWQTTESAIFASADLGDTWVVADGGLAAQRKGRIGVTSLAFDQGPPSRLYLGRSYSILRSQDAGASWAYALHDEESAGQGVLCIHISQLRSGRVWASLQSPIGVSLIARSEDWGDNWQTFVPAPRSEVAFYSLLEDPDVPTAVWAGMDGGILRSDDLGETWATTLSDNVSVTDLLVLDGDVLAVANYTRIPANEQATPTEMLRLYRRHTGLESWEHIQVLQDIGGSLSAIIDDQRRLIVGTRGTGVWRWVP